MVTLMHPDELIKMIYRRLQFVRPDDDPGDITISVQDDVAMATVAVEGSKNLTTHASTIQEALEQTYEKAMLMKRETHDNR